MDKPESMVALEAARAAQAKMLAARKPHDGVAPGFPAKCFGHLRSFPPYVGGDDEPIDEWQAECMCGWLGTKTVSVGRAQSEMVKHLNGSVREMVRQHSAIWECVTTGNGMQSPLGGEGWRDAEFRAWVRWVGPMVECPECAFMFGADHFDDTPEGGYSCPNCHPVKAESRQETDA